jgi:membrane protein
MHSAFTSPLHAPALQRRALWSHVRPHALARRPSPSELGQALWNELVRDGGAIDAGALLAYYTVLAIFPFALLALSIVAFVPLHGLDQQLIDLIWQVMPHDVAKLCTDVLRDVVGKQHGILLVAALVGALWTASSAVSATTNTLNHTWDVRESRPWWRAKGLALLVTICSVLTLIAGTTGILLFSEVGRAILDAAGVAHSNMPLHTFFGGLVRYGIIVVAMLLVTSLSYRLLPNIKGKRTILPGAIFATVLWVIGSLGFGYYLSHFASYAKVYGALGTAVVLLTWLYLSSMVLILGGGINAAFDHAAKGDPVVPRDHE